MKTKIHCLFLIFFLFFSALQVVHATGLGASPAHLKFLDVLPSQEYSQTIRIQNTANETMSVQLSTPAQWILFERTELSIPPESTYVVPVHISAARSQNQTLESQITCTGTLTTTEQSLGVVPAVVLRVSVQHTDQEQSKARVDSIRTRDTTTQPRFSGSVTNTGNIEIMPQLHLAIQSKGTPVSENTLEIGTLQPYEQHTFALTYPDTLPTGAYTVRASVIVADEIIHTNDIQFKVLDVPLQTGRATTPLDTRTPSHRRTVVGIALLGALIVVAGIIYHVHKKKQHL